MSLCSCQTIFLQQSRIFYSLFSPFLSEEMVFCYQNCSGFFLLVLHVSKSQSTQNTIPWFRFYFQIYSTHKGRENFCAGYRCTSDGWSIGFSVCVCPDENILREMAGEVRRSELKNSEKFSKDLKLCCNSTLLTEPLEDHDGNYKTLSCPINITKETDPNKNLTCTQNQWNILDIGLVLFSSSQTLKFWILN